MSSSDPDPKQPLRTLPAGTFVLLMASGEYQVVPNLDHFEVDDGDLVMTSHTGNVGRIPVGAWFAIGRLERSGGLTWVAIEALAKAAA